jgi:pSer/pThr/pTyr-binding forkhead associated (FHA) protein
VDAYVWSNLAEAYFPVQMSQPEEEPFPSEEDPLRSGEQRDKGATGDPPRVQHSLQTFSLEVVETNDSRLRAASIPLGQTNKNGLVTIGRDKKNTVALSRDIEASSEHARISLESAYWESHVWLVDLGSKNGTFVNASRVSSSRVASAAHQCELRPDDVVRIGKTSFKLVVETLPSSQPLPPRTVSNAAIRSQWRLTKEEREEQAQRQKRYADRAAERRVEPGEGSAQASAEAYIPKVSRANPGRKLLERMGWQPGQGLGAEGDGIQRPVLQSTVRGRQGLGFGSKPS